MNLLPDLVEYDETEGYCLEEDPTGLLNEGFRYRDPVTGTFLTRDPLGFIAGPNMYTYVKQNPWTRFDPEGLDGSQSTPPPPPPPPPPAKTSSNAPPPKKTTPPNQPASKSDGSDFKFTPMSPTLSDPPKLSLNMQSQQQQAASAAKDFGLTPPSTGSAPTASAKSGTEITLTQGPGGAAGAGVWGLGGFLSGSIQYGVIINPTNLLDSRFTLQIQGNVMAGVGMILTGGSSQSVSVSGEKSKTGFSGEGAVHMEGASELPGMPVTGGAAVDVSSKTLGLGGGFKAKGTTREGVGGGAFIGAGGGYTESINSPTIGQMAKFLNGLF